MAWCASARVVADFMISWTALRPPWSRVEGGVPVRSGPTRPFAKPVQPPSLRLIRYAPSSFSVADICRQCRRHVLVLSRYERGPAG